MRYRDDGMSAPSCAGPRAQGYVSHEGCDHIFFVGFLGAGKSTVARNLGRMFHRPYVDTDRLAERICHLDLAQVYATQGEEAFRDAETQALRGLASQKSLLVSCGGGIVERPQNIELMHQMGVVLFLDGGLDDSLRQIQRTDRRPDLGTHAQAERLYARRRPLYEAACDYSVLITNRTFDEVAQAAGELLWEKGLL